MANPPGDTPGERTATRERMDRFVGHLVANGTPVEKAKELGFKEALKFDEGRGARRQ